MNLDNEDMNDLFAAFDNAKADLEVATRKLKSERNLAWHQNSQLRDELQKWKHSAINGRDQVTRLTEVVKKNHDWHSSNDDGAYSDSELCDINFNALKGGA